MRKIRKLTLREIDAALQANLFLAHDWGRIIEGKVYL